MSEMPTIGEPPRDPDGDDSVPETEPGVAGVVFGEQIEAARRYARLLCDAGVVRGLLGPREVGRIWSRHLLNCAAIAPLIPANASVCDLGSGAGLPGIPLALARPDLQVTLLEPLLRRATFLTEVIEDLELSSVTVDRGRAEERRGAIVVDTVVVRAVAPLDRLLGWAAALVAPGGQVLAWKGEHAQAELAAVRPRLRRAGIEEAHVEVLSLDGLPGVATVVRMQVSENARRKHTRTADPARSTAGAGRRASRRSP